MIPDCSLVIVSWNARRYLLDCLHSVAETASGLPTETVVVDNASSDGSAEAVRAAFPSVRVIENLENLGFARANNIGIRAAVGRYVCLVNSDVLLLDGCLERLVALMDTHPEVGLAGPRIRNADHTLQPSARCFPCIRNSLCETFGLHAFARHVPLLRGQFMTWWPHDTERQVEVLSGCFWMIRREALEQVGLLDEGFFIYGEDVDWCLRLRRCGWRAMLVPAAEAVHFGGASSANAPVRFTIAMQKARLRYWRKHHGRGGAAFCWGNMLVYHSLRVLLRGCELVLRGGRSAAARAKLARATACLLWLFTGNERNGSAA